MVVGRAAGVVASQSRDRVLKLQLRCRKREDIHLTSFRRIARTGTVLDVVETVLLTIIKQILYSAVLRIQIQWLRRLGLMKVVKMVT